MKTTLTFFLLMTRVIACWGQGAVDFRNSQSNFPTPADRKVYDVDGTTPLVGPGFVAQLYYNVGFGMNNPATMLSVTNPPATFGTPGTALPGTWTGGGLRLLNGVAAGTSSSPGGQATLQVRVWDVGLGGTWEAAQISLMHGATGKFGMSAPFNYEVPQSCLVTCFYMDNLRAFALVPEPRIISLGLLMIICFLFRIPKLRSLFR